jgi:hypothetical protein
METETVHTSSQIETKTVIHILNNLQVAKNPLSISMPASS